MNEATMPTTSFGVLFLDIGHAGPRNGGRLVQMYWAYVLLHRPDDCRVAMDSKFDAKSGQWGRSIPRPRQTLNIGAALAQGSAARFACGQKASLTVAIGLAESARPCDPSFGR